MFDEVITLCKEIGDGGLRAENARLQEENSKLHAEIRAWSRSVESWVKKCERLEDENDKLRREKWNVLEVICDDKLIQISRVLSTPNGLRVYIQR